MLTARLGSARLAAGHLPPPPGTSTPPRSGAPSLFSHRPAQRIVGFFLSHPDASLTLRKFFESRFAHYFPPPPTQYQRYGSKPLISPSLTKRDRCWVWRRKAACSRSHSWEETELGFEPGPFSAVLSTLLCRRLVTACLMDVRLLHRVTQISASLVGVPWGLEEAPGEARPSAPCPLPRCRAASGYGWIPPTAPRAGGRDPE